MSSIQNSDHAIGLVKEHDLREVSDWVNRSADLSSPLWVGPGTDNSATKPERHLTDAVSDGLLFWVRSADGPLSAAQIDLDSECIRLVLPAKNLEHIHWLDRLMTKTEQRAVQFGLTAVSIDAPQFTRRHLEAAGYRPLNDPAPSDRQNDGFLGRKSLARRQTRYSRKVLSACRELGIPKTYGRDHKLTLQTELAPQHQSAFGEDVFGRQAFGLDRAVKGWHRMRHRASTEGVDLQLVSAFRSLDYQKGLLQRKLERGSSLSDILAVSAAPGFSEHHTGRAIDITTPGYDHLEEEFECSDAFAWLTRYAPEFGFRLSYPKNNRHQVAYEPWHWFFSCR